MSGGDSPGGRASHLPPHEPHPRTERIRARSASAGEVHPLMVSLSNQERIKRGE
jgi:hypothetical protein